MTALAITVLDASPSAQTAAPAITFRLRIEDLGEGRVHALVLRCQTRIEPRGRRYTNDEQSRLYELFGDASQWDRSLNGVTWAQTSLVVPSFERRIDVDLPVACTYDLEVASAKYLHAIRDGDVPLAFLFSGTIFKTHDASRLTIEPVPWDLGASFRMHAPVWHAAMDQFFPGGGWLRLRRQTIDRLQAFRGQQAVVSWDEAIDQLLLRAASEQAL
jgi:hypothetical protein